jgi:RNA polymerase sigma factor (sigma-70 family)
MIKGSRSDRERALKIVYQKNKNLVFSYILKNSGSLDQAKDVYQETIIAYYENVKADKFKAESSMATYIYSIAKFKWLNQIKKNNTRNAHHDKIETETFHHGHLVTIIDEERKQGILDVLSELGDGCKNLLIESIYNNASMKEIVQQGDYSSEQIVRNKKYKCIQKLKKLILANPALMNKLKAYD